MQILGQGFGELIFSMGLFTLTHFLFSATPLRTPLVRRLGKTGFIIFYNIVSLAFFIWAVIAYVRAPYVELWPLTAAAGVFAIAIMPIAAVLVVAGYSTTNPLSVIGEKHMAKPPQGIIKITRHPVMWSSAFFAAAHIVANGDVASIIFFTLFAVVALGGSWHMDYRMQARHGDAYRKLAAVTSFVPFMAIFQGRASVSMAEVGWLKVLGGLVLYGLLLAFHGSLVGADLLSRL